MVNGWYVTLGLVNLYVILLVWLVRSGRMEKWNLGLLLGFILMIRTQKGRNALATIAKPKRFWNAAGDVGIVAALVSMLGITVLMLWTVPTLLNPRSGIEALGASEILVIPGVNPFVPLWYGIFALVVTLIVHEGGHGILALANNMRLKSLGLLYAIVPIGAFVEPDEQDMVESSRRSRLRVYAAGPGVNFSTALLCLGALALLFAAASPAAGVHVWQITADAPSDMSGMVPGSILVGADNVSFEDWTTFSAFMATKSPGDLVNFTTRDGAAHGATLTSRWDAIGEPARNSILMDGDPHGFCDALLGAGNWEDVGDCSDQLAALPFLGVSPYPTEAVDTMFSTPFEDAGLFLQLTFLPVGEVRGSPILSSVPDFFEAPWSPTAFWILINGLFWVFWMNLMVGLTNVLPMLPLDGGHLFRDAMAGVMLKLRPNSTPAVRDRLVGRIAGGMSFLILGAFLLQIFGPRLAGLFA